MDRWDPSPLSASAKSCWGKSDRENGSFMSLYRHLSDTAEVAGLLWDQWLPPHVLDLIRGPLDVAQGRTLMTWLAAAHDLGKATPTFAFQVPSLAAAMYAHGLKCTQFARTMRTPHSTESHLILVDWLTARGLTTDAASALAVIPGGHHGTSPRLDQFHLARQDLVRGDGPWLAVQQELADWVASCSGIEELLEPLSRQPPSPQAQILITAAVILADWVASSELFPFERPGTAQERAASAWDSLQLTQPWVVGPNADDAELFRSRFDLPDEATMRPVQRDVAVVARETTAPGLIVVEAPMGEGKTEAALLAAEILAQRFELGGCFVALPTMATSDAMYGRVAKWVDRLGAGTVSMYLAHGKASLNADFRGLERVGSLHGIGDDEYANDPEVRDDCGAGAVVAHEWLTGRKKGVLSTFVVGTIDQILMGALRSRHLVLRHLALAGKVVIIDEVHSADEFMSVFLERALHWLAAYGVPVVLLSATLSSGTRDRLVAAYRSGLVPTATASSTPDPPAIKKRRPPARNLVAKGQPTTSHVAAESYPRVTVVSSNSVDVRPSPTSGRHLEIKVEYADDEADTLTSIIQTAQIRGGVVAVLRNTVRRAQQTAQHLRKGLPGTEVVLAHSRFLAADRAELEKDLRDRLGPPGAGTRPDRLIIVGTQVLEQSLDVDFDLLITDLAPVDLLMQRLGRLHRHRRPARDRGSMADPRCVLVGVEDWAAEPPVADEGSTFVYGRAALLRSAWVIRRHLGAVGSIALPDDIAGLVEKAYATDFTVPDGWQSEFAEAEAAARLAHLNKIAGAETFVLDTVPKRNLIGWAALGVGDAETPTGRARVRDGEDGLEVLVAQEINGHRRVLPWIDRYGSAELPLNDPPAPAVAKALARCSVRLPAALTAPWRFDRVIDQLEAAGCAAWQRSPWLRGELVLVLDENLESELAGVRIRYSRQDGLICE